MEDKNRSQIQETEQFRWTGAWRACEEEDWKARGDAH